MKRRSLLLCSIVLAALVGADTAHAATPLVRGGVATVTVTCPKGDGDCRQGLTATVVETRRGGRVVAVSATKPSHPRGTTRTVVVGQRAAVVVANGTHKAVRLRLNATGRALARRFQGMRVSVRTTSTPAKPTQPSTPTPVPLPYSPGCDGAPRTPPAGGPGQTAIVGYFENAGGPVLNCSDGMRSGIYWASGAIYVWDQLGTLVASVAVAPGEQFTLPLAPGTYTVRGVPQGQPAPASPTDAYCVGYGEGVTDVGVVSVADGRQTPLNVICSIP